jgi:hypothetical protein
VQGFAQDLMLARIFYLTQDFTRSHKVSDSTKQMNTLKFMWPSHITWHFPGITGWPHHRTWHTHRAPITATHVLPIHIFMVSSLKTLDPGPLHFLQVSIKVETRVLEWFSIFPKC